MPIIVSHKEVESQSETVWKQFGESKWIPFAKENAKLERRNANELKGCGVGKTLVLAAMGESLEKQIDVLKKYQDRVDIITCDKGFVPLMKHGVKPKYVMICDCNVRYSHIEDYVQQTEDITLIATPYAHTAWTTMWKGPRYFYVNKDALTNLGPLGSAEVFLPIMGMDSRVIPASSNVSNSMFVFMSGCDEKSTTNWAGYERYLMVGYDYCWRPNGNYYAWDNPAPKRHYMTHRLMLDIKNEPVRTSENLMFSMKWLYSYITNYKIPAVNCSDRGILGIPMQSNLEAELKKVNPDPRSSDAVRQHYEMAQIAARGFETAKELFFRSREELWLSETVQR